jgi:hypothetical protein
VAGRRHPGWCGGCRGALGGDRGRRGDGRGGRRRGGRGRGRHAAADELRSIVGGVEAGAVVDGGGDVGLERVARRAHGVLGGGLDPQHPARTPLVDDRLVVAVEGDEVPAARPGREHDEGDHDDHRSAEGDGEAPDRRASGGGRWRCCISERRGRQGRVGFEFERARRRRVGSTVRPQRRRVQFPGRIGRIVAVEHVEDDDRHVVATAGGVRLLDEQVGSTLRIVLGGEGGGDVVVVDLVDQPVAAQQEPVAADQRQRPPVDADVGFDAERPRDDVAPRVVARFVLVDVAGRHQFLDVAVVDGDPSEATVAEQVGARVADVGQHERLARLGRHDRGDVAGQSTGVGVGGVAVAARGDGGSCRIVVVDVRFGPAGVVITDHGDRRDGRAHARVAGVGDRGPEDVAVGRADRRHDVLGRRQRVAAQQFGDPLDGDQAGHLAGLVAAHPVGHDERVRGDEQVVLVGRADLARVGGRADAEIGHQRAPRVERARSALTGPRSRWCRPGCGRRDGAAWPRGAWRRCGTCRSWSRGPRPSAGRRGRRRAGGAATRRRRRRS